jgi:hypothetical protein
MEAIDGISAPHGGRGADTTGFPPVVAGAIRVSPGKKYQHKFLTDRGFYLTFFDLSV